MRIQESELHRNYQWPIREEDKNNYTLSALRVDAYELLRETDLELQERIKSIGSDCTTLWGTEFLSLQDIDLPRHFEPLTGAIKLPSLLKDERVRNFFSPRQRHYQYRGTFQNRGKSYYLAVDPAFITNEEKVAVMKQDMNEGMDATANFTRDSTNTDELIGYLGVLDYLKQHALTAFHVITYPERLGDFKQTDEYKEYRERAANLARFFTRNYYQTFLGLPSSDFPHPEELRTEVTDVLEFINAQDRNYRQYTVQEVDHPLRMVTHVDQTLKQGYKPDTLVAMMSGGTQTAMLFKLAYEIQNPGKEIPMIYLPLSRHSANITFGKVFSATQLQGYIGEHHTDIEGRTVQVVEDNANSGQTAQLIHDALIEEGASEARLSFVEIDPYRVMYKQRKEAEKRSDFVANFTHPDFQTAVGVLPVARSIKQDYQLRKLYVWNIFDKYNGRKYE